jgi:hypothetical protein
VHEVAELDHGQVFGKRAAVRIRTKVAECDLKPVGVALDITDERNPKGHTRSLRRYRGSLTRRW